MKPLTEYALLFSEFHDVRAETGMSCTKELFD